jgi:hypothetical protein
MIGKFLRICEDSCSAAVVGHLLHLPVEMFWSILSQASFSNSLPEDSGQMLDPVQYWPSWDATGTRNSSRVAPDIFLRFADFDLIIEAKRWDENMQSPQQWKDQLTAYHNEFDDENKKVILIALGGIHSHADESIEIGGNDLQAKKCPVIKCTWARILGECKKASADLRRNRHQSSQSLAHLRILADVEDLLGWHGFLAARWFEDFPFTLNRLSPHPENHSRILSHISSALVKS